MWDNLVNIIKSNTLVQLGQLYLNRILLIQVRALNESTPMIKRFPGEIRFINTSYDFPRASATILLKELLLLLLDTLSLSLSLSLSQSCHSVSDYLYYRLKSGLCFIYIHPPYIYIYSYILFPPPLSLSIMPP